MQSILTSQYTTARVYFFSILLLLFVEALIRLPLHIRVLFHSGEAPTKPPSPHSRIYLYLQRLFTRPAPFPSISSLTLPDAIRLVLVIGLNVLWGWNRNKYTSDFDLYGWLTLANGGLTLLCAARNNLFVYVLRIPATTLLMYHRWLGVATVIDATVHFSFLTRTYVRNGQLADIASTFRVQVGLMAWISLCIVLLSSLYYVRRLTYEVFYYLHFLFILFLVGALIHATHAAEFLVPGLALWVIDRAIRFASNFRPIEVVSAQLYPGDLTKFKLRGLRTTGPGQIAWVHLPALSGLNWHPFTLASAPNAKKEVTVAIRGLGNYTKRVQALDTTSSSSSAGWLDDTAAALATAAKPTVCPTTLRVRLDGPYHVSRLPWGRLPHGLNLLVAGGIGITPAISIASTIVAHAVTLNSQPVCPNRPVRTLTPQRIHLLWTVRAAAHVSWFADELAELYRLLPPSVTLEVSVYVTSSSSSSSSSSARNRAADSSMEMETGAAGYDADTLPPILRAVTARAGKEGQRGLMMHKGRPNMAAFFGGLRERYPGSDAAVLACGPRAMTADVRRGVVSSGEGWRGMSREGAWKVEEEVFEF